MAAKSVPELLGTPTRSGGLLYTLSSRYLFTTIFFTIFFYTMVLVTTEAAAEPTSVAYVQIRTAVLRKGPQQWSSAVAQLGYGSAVSIVNNAAEPWLVAKSESGESGYIHRSALSNQKIIFLKTATKTDLNDASMSNVVLAGKGFNEDVENIYSKNNPAADLNLIDQIEQQNSKTRTELGSFVQSGKLHGTILKSSSGRG